MTNRIFEGSESPVFAQYMGYTECDNNCGRVIKGSTCVMCEFELKKESR